VPTGSDSAGVQIPPEILDVIRTNVNSVVTQVLSFVKRNNLDGLELNCHSMARAIPSVFDIVVKELAQKLKLEHTHNGCPLELNVRIPQSAGPDLSQTYTAETLSTSFDSIVMQVGQKSTQFALPHSALFTGGDAASMTNTHTFAVWETLYAWTNPPMNVKANKVVMMLPAYSLAYDLDDHVKVTPVPYMRVEGLEDDDKTNPGRQSVTKTCEELQKGAMSIVDSELMIAYSKDKDDDHFVFYDTNSTLVAKRGFAVKNHLRGIGLNSLNDDDFTNKCMMGKFWQLHAINMQNCDA